MKHRSKKSLRTDPLFSGFEHVANQTKLLRSGDTKAFDALEKQTGSSVGALRYVGQRAKMPRKNAAEEDKKKADERLASLKKNKFASPIINIT